MKVAYIISEIMCVSPHNGIRVQAESWAAELVRQGHEVIKVNPWEMQDWSSYDVIHIFGYSPFLKKLNDVPNRNIVFSPIIDSFMPIWLYRFVTYWGCKKMRISSTNYDIRSAKPYIKKWFVRSHFEFEYVHRAYGVPKNNIVIVPLSFRISPPTKYPRKENFCLHVSKLTDSRKNVERLVDAAIQGKFQLVLAGSVSQDFDKSTLKKKIERHDNIRYLGRVSDEELINLYCSAKVFALPSIGEGVGLVALEAAVCGCEIVITNIGGPKEYYGGKAFTVNPFHTEQICKAVLDALDDNKFQPDLMYSIKSEYNIEKCVNHLVNIYASE